MIIENTLWTEKYRPKTLQDYVWVDASQKQQVESWVASKNIPHLLLSGPAGVGKTSLAKMLLNELGVHSSDVKYINASFQTGIDYFRSLVNFVETMSMSEYRYVMLDEADRMSEQAKDLLKNMIEEYSSSCRWILTTNHPNRITPPIKSRCVWFHIDQLDQEQYLTRAAQILIDEGIDLDDESLEILQEYTSVCYPDLRKCINFLQQNSHNGRLQRPSSSSKSSGTQEYLISAVSLFKNGQIKQARELICENIKESDYEDVYRLLYKNLTWWGSTETQQNMATIQIANRLRDHSTIADPELNLAACLIELAMISEQ